MFELESRAEGRLERTRRTAIIPALGLCLAVLQPVRAQTPPPAIQAVAAERKPKVDDSLRPAPGSGASGRRFIQVFISRNDRNGDGIVEKSEFRGSATRFDEMDANHNGRLEPDELLPLFRSRLNDPKGMQERLWERSGSPGPTTGAGSTNRFLKAMGARGRSGGTPRQVAGYATIFGRLDADGDGRLTTKEFVEDGMYLTPQARAGIFKASDSDADGTVTRAEYVENRIITDEAKAMVDRADANGDRTITKAEFVAHPGLTNAAMAAEIFVALDANADGKITTPEYLRVWGGWAREGRSSDSVKAIQPGPERPGRPGFDGAPEGRFPGGGPPSPEVLLQRFDRNQDGRLTRDEVPELLWSRLSAADSNRDDIVTQAELSARRPVRGPRR